MAEAAAGSVLLRGLMYSMCHPAPRRFLSLRAPAMFTNSKAAGLNVQQLRDMSWLGDRYDYNARNVCSSLTACHRCVNDRCDAVLAARLRVA